MKLLVLAILFFILLPWQLMAPVAGPADHSTEAEQAGTAVPAPPLVRTEEPVPPVTEAKPLGAVTPPPPAAPVQKPVVYDEAYVALLEKAIHDRINAERVRAGIGLVAYNDLLAQVAALHSTDMATENYFAHEDEEGCTSSCRVTAAGYEWRTVGENLFLLKSTYRYTVEDASAVIVQGWMGSDGHRKNVLHDDFTEEGIGVVILGDSIYATEVFARPR